MDGLKHRGKPNPLTENAGIAEEDDHDQFKLHKKKPVQAPFDWKTPLVLLLLALATRLYQIGKSNKVVWDEAHFGKFASYYIKREFYFDVHPPLGKIMLGFSGVLAGINGTFEFTSGKEYPQDFHYSTMRVFCAFFGSFLVPLAYLTCLELKTTKIAALLAALMVLLDTALLTISRFILLDSLLLFFTSTSAYCLTKFRNYQVSEPFSRNWWLWLSATGASIGCVASVKWVGLFSIALVGLHTLNDLWDLLADLKMPKMIYAKHWIARILCLILLPVAIYLFSFYLHFAILTRSGPGDAQMSSLFQAGLLGNNFDENPLELAYGSRITLKSNGHGGGLLHSHIQRYPSGSEQQQVTCYHHKDSNNDWIIKRSWADTVVKDGEEVEELDTRFVEDGDIVRLVHKQTDRNLHSHQVKAPVTSIENEVSCYGNHTVGDMNDNWKVEIVNDASAKAKDNNRIRSLSTRFRLKHVTLGCYLQSHAVTLPQWGFKQAEVICSKYTPIGSRNLLWNVEHHWNSALKPAGKNAFKSHFLQDFIDLNVAMWTSNNALTPDPDKEPDALVSQPYEWFLALVGLRMCGWDNNNVKYYLLGNPVIWWGVAASIVGFVFTVLFFNVRSKRRIVDFTPAGWDDFLFAGKVGWGGWFLHYMPFWIMGRVTYLHHYFPSLYFGILLSTFMLDHLSARYLPARFRSILLSLVGAIVIVVFIHFKDFSYGFTGDAIAYKDRKWYKNWNIYDPRDNVKIISDDDAAGRGNPSIEAEVGGSGSGDE